MDGKSTRIRIGEAIRNRMSYIMAREQILDYLSQGYGVEHRDLENRVYRSTNGEIRCNYSDITNRFFASEEFKDGWRVEKRFTHLDNEECKPLQI